MKKINLLSLIILFLLGFGALNAQNKQKLNNKGEKKYALLVSAEDHIKMATKTAQTLFNDPKYNARSFEVIICGKAVETLKGDAEWNKVFEEGNKNGITYKACGISVEKFKINLDVIPKEVKVIPNGILQMYDLKAEGYITVEL